MGGAWEFPANGERYNLAMNKNSTGYTSTFGAVCVPAKNLCRAWKKAIGTLSANSKVSVQFDYGFVQSGAMSSDCNEMQWKAGDKNNIWRRVGASKAIGTQVAEAATTGTAHTGTSKGAGVEGFGSDDVVLLDNGNMKLLFSADGELRTIATPTASITAKAEMLSLLQQQGWRRERMGFLHGWPRL